MGQIRFLVFKDAAEHCWSRRVISSDWIFEVSLEKTLTKILLYFKVDLKKWMKLVYSIRTFEAAH